MNADSLIVSHVFAIFQANLWCYNLIFLILIFKQKTIRKVIKDNTILNHIFFKGESKKNDVAEFLLSVLL